MATGNAQLPPQARIVELTSAAQAGMLDALSALLDEVRPWLVRYCTYAVRTEQGEDLAQIALERFATAVRRADNPISPGAARVYLRKIADRLIAAEYQSKRRSRDLVSLDAVETAPANEATMDAAQYQDLAMRLLDVSADRLSPISQAVILLSADGWTVAEIAARLATTADVVLHRRSRARRTLRAALRPFHPAYVAECRSDDETGSGTRQSGEPIVLGGGELGRVAS